MGGLFCRDTENPALPRSTLACTTRCPGRLHACHSTGLVLNTRSKAVKGFVCFGPCDFVCRRRFFVLIPPFCLPQLNIRPQLRCARRASCHTRHCEPRYISAEAVFDQPRGILRCLVEVNDTAFSAAMGFARAWALPISISYGPAAPNDWPSNARRQLVVSSWVTRESPCGGDGEAVWLGSMGPHPLPNAALSTRVVSHFRGVIWTPKSGICNAPTPHASGVGRRDAIRKKGRVRTTSRLLPLPESKRKAEGRSLENECAVIPCHGRDEFCDRLVVTNFGDFDLARDGIAGANGSSETPVDM